MLGSSLPTVASFSILSIFGFPLELSNVYNIKKILFNLLVVLFVEYVGYGYGV